MESREGRLRRFQSVVPVVGAILLASLVPSSGAASQPYSDAEFRKVINEDERRIREIREQEIAQLKLTLSRRLPQERRADLYLRLAEIYIEAYRAEYLLEGRVHELRLDRNIEDKRIDHSRSRPYLKFGIQACQEIIDLKLRYERMDQVFYFMAYNHSELGDDRRAQAYYQAIVQKFPRSSFAVEAYKELGEAAFSARNYRAAEGYFEKVLELAPQAPGFQAQIPRVRHRLAWCLYRQKQYTRAVAEMKDAVRLALAGKEKLLSIREEALRDLAIFMTETGNVDEAIGYFQKVAGDLSYYPRILEGLGRQYERNVEPEKAVQVYESLLKTRPDDEAAFRFRVKLVDLDLRRALYDRALSRFVSSPDREIRLYGDADGDTQTAWLNLRAMVRRTATESHEKYRKSSDRKALELAEKFYEAYLSPLLAISDPRAETPEIQMYLADVKRELGRAREASDLYKKVIASRDKRYGKEAAALWTASLADAIKKDEASRPADRKLRSEPSKLELDFVKASDELAELIPGTTEAREAEVRAAQVLAGYPASRQDAISRLKRILKRHPDSPQAITSARLWLQVHLDDLDAAEKRSKSSDETRDALEALLEQVEEIRENEDFIQHDRRNGAKVGAQLAEIEARSRVMRIVFYERDGQLKQAARAYEEFAETAPARDTMSKAYENAVATYLKLGDMESADRVVAVWQKRIPGNEGAAQALRNSATLLFIQGRFADSAKVLERIGMSSNDPDSLESAIRIFEATGDERRVNELAAKFSRNFAKSPGRVRVVLGAALWHESLNKDAIAAQYFKECLEIPGAEEQIECSYRLGMLYLRIGAEADGLQLLRRASAGQSRGPAIFFVSAARWELARQADQRISAGPGASERLTLENLATVLPGRLKAFEQVQKAMAPVLDMGGPYSVQASYRIARSAIELAAEMEKLASGEKGVAEPVRVLRSRATQILRQAVTKAQENEWMNPEMPRVLGVLSLLERGPRAQGAFPSFQWMDPAGALKKAPSIDQIRESLVKNARDAASWARYGQWLAVEEEQIALALIALERAYFLDPKSAAILNNIGLIKGLKHGVEDTHGALQMNAHFKQAQAFEDPTGVARSNRAQLLNYYGMFGAARKLWEQLPGRSSSSRVEQGLATALQGVGSITEARSTFARAVLSGGDERSFVHAFHLAAAAGHRNPAECLEKLGEIRRTEGAFEKAASELLQSHCESWEKRASASTAGGG